MNWKTISKHAALLLATGLVIGFFENGHVLAGQIAYLVAYTAIFTHLSFRQHDRVFLHAVLAVLLSETIATLVLWLIPGGLSQPGPLVLLDIVTIVVALTAGTLLGILARRKHATSQVLGSSR